MMGAAGYRRIIKDYHVVASGFTTAARTMKGQQNLCGCG